MRRQEEEQSSPTFIPPSPLFLRSESGGDPCQSHQEEISVLQCHQEISIPTNVSSVQFSVCKDISMYLNYGVVFSAVYVSQCMCVCFSVSSQLASA